MPDSEGTVSVGEQEVIGGSPAPPVVNSTNVMRVLTREQILGAQDIVTKHVEVPEWGGTVIVRGLTGKERDEWEDAMIVRSEKRGKNQPTQMTLHNIRAGLVARSIVDSEGNRVFSVKDIEQLATKSAAALDRVYTVAGQLSGVTDADVEDLAEDFSEGSDLDDSSPTP